MAKRLDDELDPKQIEALLRAFKRGNSEKAYQEERNRRSAPKYKRVKRGIFIGVLSGVAALLIFA